MSADRDRVPSRAGTRLLALALVMICGSSFACAHDGIPDPLAQTELMSAGELEEQLWPAGAEQRWRPLAEHELVALERLVLLLLEHAEAGELGPAQRRRAGALATLVGLELSSVEVRAEGRGRAVSLWVLREIGSPLRGRGAYLVRRGPVRGSARGELIIEAPHVFFDRHTGELALALFLSGVRGEPGADEQREGRALFVNTVHRYRHEHSESPKKRGHGDDPADAAHDLDHPLARVSAKVVAKRNVQLVQLHGFKRSAASGDPEVIVSSGRREAELEVQASWGVKDRLQRAMPEVAVGHFGVDVDRLGALTNVQGHAAHERRRCFVHIEIADGLRLRLVEDLVAQRRFTAAVLGTAAVVDREPACR